MEVNHDICLNKIETHEGIEEESTVSNTVADTLLAKYYIGSAEVADQEPCDEEYSFKVSDLSNYDLTDELVEEQGGEAVPVAQVMMAEVKEKDKCTEPIKDELTSLKTLEVHEELSPTEAYTRYWGKKIPTKILPAKLVLVKSQYTKTKKRREHRRGKHRT